MVVKLLEYPTPFDWREVVKIMCTEVIKQCPEFADELVPMCVREGSCHEMQPCGKR